MQYIRPISIPQFNIYDIAHSDNNKLVIICPWVPNPPIIHYIPDLSSKTNSGFVPFELNICPHAHTLIYTLADLVQYTPVINLQVNLFQIQTQVNKYPIFNNEIILSTIVKNESNYVVPWIEFHNKLGISRFIIYDNSDEDSLGLVLEPYIKNKLVTLIKWNYPYRLAISGISGQTTQQNHSIYVFGTSKYIGLFDIDEYINIQTNIKSIDAFFSDLVSSYGLDLSKIGSFKILNKFFYNPDNLPTDGTKFLSIYNCDQITEQGHEKNFVIPSNVQTFSVHMITSGKPMCLVPPTDIFFNHYYYLNKQDRGRNKTPYLDNSINKSICFNHLPKHIIN